MNRNSPDLTTKTQRAWRQVPLFAMLRRSLCLCGSILLCGSAWAQWKPSSLGDQERNWSAHLSLQGVYDDNIGTSSSGNSKAGLGESVTPSFSVRLPSERTSMGLRYTYTYTHYDNQLQDQQTHVADATFFHSFNPRLVLTVQDSVRRGLEPSLVQDVSGVPVVVRERGDYILNAFSSTLSYTLTRRWNVSVGGSWQLWRYDVASYASYLDRDDYSGNASMLYMLTPRTSIGGTYAYTQAQYVTSGTNGVRNSNSHTLFLSAFHKFNPMLSAQLSSGVSVFQFVDRQQDFAPYVNLSGVYNFSSLSSVSAGVTYSMTRAEQSNFRTVDTAAFYARADYKFTSKLSAALDGAYILSQYGNPIAASTTGSGQEDSWRLQLSCAYAFQNWVSLTASYIHEESSSDLLGRAFDRNRIFMGLNLSY